MISNKDEEWVSIHFLFKKRFVTILLFVVRGTADILILCTNISLLLIHSLMKSKGDLERERDELKAEIDNNNNKVDVLERTIGHLKETIDNKVVTNTK